MIILTIYLMQVAFDFGLEFHVEYCVSMYKQFR